MRKIVLILIIGFFSCSEGRPPSYCEYSDECESNFVCSTDQHECISAFGPPLGKYVKGSIMSPCVKWNDSDLGAPKEFIRANQDCVSGYEYSEECPKEFQSSEGAKEWLRICF